MRTLNIIAGLVPVTGPGPADDHQRVDGRVNVGSLLDTVQELRTAGAEAMEFNDIDRVGAQSSFDNAVGGIELDGHLLEPPYVLDVIGDPHVLQHARSPSRPGPIETLETFDGASVEVEELDSVDITSVRDPVATRVCGARQRPVACRTPPHPTHPTPTDEESIVYPGEPEVHQRARVGPHPR